MFKKQFGFSLSTNLITIAVIILLLAFAVFMLPRGFSEDVSRIGQGSNIVVLAHNKNSMQSMDLMELLNKVRDDYSGEIDFLVVDKDTETGKKFIQEQNIGDSVLVLIDQSGNRLMVLNKISDEKEFRRVLNNAFQI